MASCTTIHMERYRMVNGQEYRHVGSAVALLIPEMAPPLVLLWWQLLHHHQTQSETRRKVGEQRQQHSGIPEQNAA
jgi:hypothetical protein